MMSRICTGASILSILILSACQPQSTPQAKAQHTSPGASKEQRAPQVFTPSDFKGIGAYETISPHDGKTQELILLTPKKLTDTIIDWANLNSAVIEARCNQPIPVHIKHLRCATNSIDANTIGKLKNLVLFDANKTTMTTQVLKALGQIATLESLKLQDTDLEDKHMVTLSPLRRLKHIDLSDNIKLTGQGIQYLHGNTMLKSLDLAEINLQTQYGKNISPFSKLVYLNVDGTKIKDETIATWHTLQDLKVLKFKYPSLTMNAWNTFHRLKKIERLEATDWTGRDWHHHKLQDKHMALIGQMTNLQNLNLTHTKVTDKGLEHLRTMKSLRELKLARMEITDQGMQHIQSLSSLTSLSTYKSKAITSKSLQYIQQLKHLRFLDLGGTQIKNADLKTLASWKHITDLSLCNAESITDKALKQHDFKHIESRISLVCKDEDHNCDHD